jgi:HD-GYP domain-containing protein (c-di-GMP phosphodiesterase class II)
MITARNVFSTDGRMLLAADKEITESYIRRLQEMEVYAIYVRNPLFDDVEIPLVLSEETRIQSMQTVKRAFEVLRNKRTDVSFDEVQSVSRRIIAEVLRNRRALVHLTEIRSHDDYTFAHSVDVCGLSVLVAVHLGYTEVKLQELAVGALLHDVGKTKIEPALLNKQAALDEDEMAMMRGHAMFGFDMLRSYQGKMTLPSIHIALQHHEKYDGTGYPRGLSKEDIHEYSRIVSIADVYDAITSDRPYRKALLPHEAYELMLFNGSQHFDPVILPLFLQRIAIYPVGTVVRLNTGDIGVVISVPPEMPLRPTLRLILDKNRRLYPGVIEFDMQNHLTSFVDQVVDGQELMKLI